MRIQHILLGGFMLLSACTTIKQMPSVTKTIFDKQGHRGCRGLMPENTIPAMLHALDLGVNTLEMDISFTADKQVILSHEAFFNHEITTKPDGGFIGEKEEQNFNIYKMTYKEVLKYDVGMKPHPRFPKQEKMKAVKPLLADLIDQVEAYTEQQGFPKTYYNIETKTLPQTDNIYHPAPEEFIDRLMAVINDKNISDRVIIQSFDVRTLQVMHRKFPKVKTALLIEDFDKTTLTAQLKKLGYMPFAYSPHYSLVNEGLVKECHAKKMRLIPWTVNDNATIDRLKALGVDGIISDYPDLFKGL
jgi:glycerophosphoryl diester phosphodiesterase